MRVVSLITDPNVIHQILDQKFFSISENFDNVDLGQSDYSDSSAAHRGLSTEFFRKVLRFDSLFDLKTLRGS